ncbi:MAG: hypothetical protein H6745_28875 [Deltaproteobacteria bacterium]|nr:hypothetical protein [Deltaproteobacteria bacterium]
MNVAASARVAPLVALVALLSTACGDSGGGGGGGGGGLTDTVGGTGTPPACTLVGDPIPLPYGRDFDVAALDDASFVLVMSGDDAVTYRVVTASAVSDPDAVAVGRGAVHLVARAGVVFLETFPLGWALGPKLATFDGAAWTATTSERVATSSSFTSGAALAASADELAVVWVDGISTTEGYIATWSDAGLSPADPALADVGDLLGYSVQAAYDLSGRLHVVVVGEVGGSRGLARATRGLDGVWGEATLVGAAPGALQNIIVTGVAADPGGGVWLAEIHGEDFLEDVDGALTVWRDGGSGATVAGTVADERPVVEGLSLAAAGAGRLVLTASWGENNLEYQKSDDEVLLYVCGATGGCRQGAVLDGRKGVFYDGTRVAMGPSGADGLAVWAWQEKGDSDIEGATAQRFRCSR